MQSLQEHKGHTYIVVLSSLASGAGFRNLKTGLWFLDSQLAITGLPLVPSLWPRRAFELPG